MFIKQTRNFLDLAEACIIFARYNNGSHTIMPDSKDRLYVSVNPNKLTVEDREKLSELGWYVSDEMDNAMVWGTGRFAHLYDKHRNLIKADNMRKFPLSTVLTLTTGHMLTTRKTTSDNGFGDMSDLMYHITGQQPSNYGLGACAEICKPYIFYWYPELDSDVLRSEVEKLASLLAGFSKNTDRCVTDAVVVGWLNSLVTRGICSANYDIGQMGDCVESKSP